MPREKQQQQLSKFSYLSLLLKDDEELPVFGDDVQNDFPSGLWIY